MKVLLLVLLISQPAFGMFVNQTNNNPHPQDSAVTDQNNATVNVHVEILNPPARHHHAKKLPDKKPCCCGCIPALAKLGASLIQIFH